MSHRAPNVTWDPPEDKVFDKEVKSVRCWHESGRHRLLIFASLKDPDKIPTELGKVEGSVGDRAKIFTCNIT